MSHGNTWSVYFTDPEGNGIEIFCETSYHVAQPAGEPWDTNSTEDELRAWTVRTFRGRTGFTADVEEYYAQRSAEIQVG